MMDLPAMGMCLMQEPITYPSAYRKILKVTKVSYVFLCLIKEHVKKICYRSGKVQRTGTGRGWAASFTQNFKF